MSNQDKIIDQQMKNKVFSFHVWGFDGEFDRSIACSIWVTAFDEDNAIRQAQTLVKR